jgi:dienelactone hydrolase
MTMARGVSEIWDGLGDFERRSLRFHEEERDVFVSGSGPGVIIIHEIPGITPEVARFARWVRDAGFRVYLPSLLGRPGQPNGAGYALLSMARACIAREFTLLSEGRTSPIVAWLTALAKTAKAECGGAGVGALGMCFSGNFSVAMMLEPETVAPVMCQPSLPVNAPGGLGLSPEDAAAVKARLEREDLTIRAYRFAGDPLCRAARFETLSRTFGPRFEGVTLPDSAAKPDTFLKSPHSVVTTHLVDEQGSPTRRAVEEIIAFFRARLGA